MKKILLLLILLTPILIMAQGVDRINRNSGSGMSDPMTTRGDMIYKNSSNTTARLAIGTNGQVITSDGTDIAWGADIGFADPMTTRGDLLYRNASNTTARLAVGANTYVLTSDGTDLSWAAPTGGDTTLWDFASQRLTAKTGVTSLNIDTVLCDYFGGTIGEFTVDGKTYLDSLTFNPIPAATALDSVLSIDRSGNGWIVASPKSEFSGGGTSYWELDGASLINDTANSDTVRMPDGVLEIGVSESQSSKIIMYESTYDSRTIEIYNQVGDLFIISDVCFGANANNYPGIKAFNQSVSGNAIYRNRLNYNYGFGGAYTAPEIIVDGRAMLTASANSIALDTNATVNGSVTIGADTNQTAVVGKIVFQAADSTFYGCRSTVANKKWYKLHN